MIVLSWIKEDDMKAIRQRADIVDVLSNYLTLDKKGKDYRAICPFHDDHDPSLSISTDKQIFKCFVCGTGGNVFTFVQKIEQITFPEAVVKVAELIHYPLVMPTSSYQPKQNINQPLYDIMQAYIQFLLYELKSNDGIKCREYLSKRHISKEILERFEIGFAPASQISTRFLQAKNFEIQKCVDAGLMYEDGNTATFFNRMMIPIHDESGNPVGFTARRLDEDKNIAKYVNTGQTPIYEKGNLIFNYHRAKETARKEHRCILVEGAMDVIAYEKAGIHEAVACLGTACTQNQIQLLKRLQVPILVGYDGDKAGRNATYKFGKLALQAGLKFQIIQNRTELDPDELLEKVGKDEFTARLSKTSSYVEFLFDYLVNVYDLDNYEDKKKYAQEIYEVIVKTCDEFEKPMYIHRIQKMTGFDFSALDSQQKTNQENKPRPKNIRPTVAIPLQTGRLSAEKALLSMLIVSKKASNDFKEQIGFFQDLTCNQLSLYIYDYYRTHDKMDIDALITCIEEEPIRNLLIELVSDEYRCKEYNETFFNDSVIKIKECALQEQIDFINKQIDELKSPTEKAKLAFQKNELIIKKLELRNQK